MEISPKDTELPLKFNKDVINRSILRKYIKAKGVTDEPIFKVLFLKIHQNIMKNAEYLNNNSIYSIK